MVIMATPPAEDQTQDFCVEVWWFCSLSCGRNPTRQLDGTYRVVLGSQHIICYRRQDERTFVKNVVLLQESLSNLQEF